MGTNMRPIQRELGFTIMEGIGDEGLFDYPAPPIRSVATSSIQRASRMPLRMCRKWVPRRRGAHP